MSFADLTKQSKLGSLTAKLVKEVEKMNTNGSSGRETLLGKSSYLMWAEVGRSAAADI